VWNAIAIFEYYAIMVEISMVHVLITPLHTASDEQYVQIKRQILASNP
jgi:hypothetical protein